MLIDLMKSVDQNILDLVIAKNPGLTMSLSQVGVGAAAELVGDPSTRNTSVLLTATGNAGFSGTRTIKYNRLDVAAAVFSLPTTVSINTADTQEQIKEKVATALGLMLSEVTIVNATGGGDMDIPANEDDTSSMARVTAIGTSKLYVGTHDIQLTIPDADIPLSEAIEFDIMDGFDSPVA